MSKAASEIPDIYPAPVIADAMPPTEENLRDLLAADEQNPALHFALGNVLLRKHRAAEALPYYQEARKLEPGNAELISNLGTALLLVGRIKEATRELENALAFKADLLFARLYLAHVQLLSKQPTVARDTLLRLLEIYPDNARAHEELAVVLEQLNDLPAAFQHYELAFQHDASRSVSRDRLCLEQVRSAAEIFHCGNRIAAYEVLAIAFAKYSVSFFGNRDIAQLFRELIRQHREEKLLALALSDFRKTFTPGASSFERHHLLFLEFFFSIGFVPEHYENSLTFERSRQNWEQSLESQGDHPYPHFKFALLHCYTGNLASARAELEHCLEKMPPKKHRSLQVDTILEFVRKVQDIEDELRAEAGVSSVVVEWQEQGFTERFEREAWKKTGLSPQEARLWKESGFSSGSAKNYHASRLSPTIALEWQAAGLNDPKRIANYVAAALLPEDALRWEKAFGENSRAIVQWSLSGFSDPDTAAAWAQEFVIPLQATQWQELGFTLEDVQQFRAMGISDPYEALKKRDLLKPNSIPPPESADEDIIH